MRRLLRSLFDGGYADDVAIAPDEPSTSSIGDQDIPTKCEVAASETDSSKDANDAARTSPLREQLREISLMDGTEFEHFTSRVFDALGYDVTLVGGAGDQGVDLVLRKGPEVIAVQCKNYGQPVGNRPVQEGELDCSCDRDLVAGMHVAISDPSVGTDGSVYGGLAIPFFLGSPCFCHRWCFPGRGCRSAPFPVPGIPGVKLCPPFYA